MLFGAISWRFPNEKLLWDGKNLRFTNNEKANEFIKPNFRKGWELQDITRLTRSAADHHDRHVGIQVRIVVNLAAGFRIERDLLVDLDLVVAAEIFEVGDGKEADVGRVVPVIAQERAGPGSAAFFVKMLAQLPVADVGEADDPLPADAEDLLEHALHVHHRLQRLREDDEVELPVGEGRQPVVQVGLHDVQPAADAGQDRLLVQLDAHDVPAAVAAQPGQQPAVAAAQVQHAGAGRNQLDDRVVVQAAAVEDARRILAAQLVQGHVGQRVVGRRAAVEIRQEGPHGLAVDRQLVGQQEGVVAAVALHVAITHRLAFGDQGVDHLLRLERREEPVGGKAHQQPAALRTGQGPAKFLARVAQVEQVDGHGEHEIAVGVEALDELVALVGQVRTDGKAGLELRLHLPGLQAMGVELLDHRLAREIR